MTNHPIAEQDSLERLIARLRKRVAVNSQGLGTAFADPLSTEAADTLEALVEVLIDWRNSYLCPASDLDECAGRLLEATDAALAKAGIEL